MPAPGTEAEAPSGVRVVAAAAADRARVLAFLRAEFFPNEPLNASVGVAQGPVDDRHIHALSSLTEGVALLATDGAGELLGACLCTETAAERDGAAGAFAGVLAALAAAADAAARAWARPVAVQRCLEVRVLAVAASARRRGVAARLLERAIEDGRRQGYHALTMLCTSAFSAALAQRAGLRLVHTQAYADLVGDGLLPRAPPPPHTHIALYVCEPLAAPAPAPAPTHGSSD